MTHTINYLDLFSGLGAFAKGLINAGFKFRNHYFSEIDKYAIANYKYNFKKSEYVGAIQKIKDEKIEKPDIITFGSPCQDISIAGKRKGIFGKRSQLFFTAIEVIDRFRPKVFVFENVKALLFNNKGKDFEVVLRAIANLGVYECQWQLINTAWLLPQNRQRIFLVGTLAEECVPNIFPLLEDYEKNQKKGSGIIEIGKYENYNQKMVFSSKGNAPTLMCGHGTPINYVKTGKKIRHLTPVECERLQGLPDDWTKYGEFENGKKEISNTQRYIMLGNAITATVMKVIGEKLSPVFSSGLEGTKNTNTMKKANTKINEIELHYKQKLIEGNGKVTNSEDAAALVRSIISKEKIEAREEMITLYFNPQNQLKGFHRTGTGGIDGLVGDVRIILSIALKSLSTSIIIAHNHPSGNRQPSEADKKISQRIKEACKVHNILFYDNLIVTSKDYLSFADEGLMGIENHYPINEIPTNSKTNVNEAEKHINDLNNFLKDDQ